MQQRAIQEGSSRGAVNPEIVNVTSVAEVTILQVSEAGVQVQVNEGPQAGADGLSRSRDAHCWAPPPQIPASGTTAPGSCLGS